MTGSRHALIVANDNYLDEGLKRLLSPSQDAVALAEVLGDPLIGDFAVQVSQNEPSHEISMRVDDFFSERRPADSLLLHFSCHGLKNPSGELYFAAPNTVPSRLASTAVPADFVRRCMAASRARSIVLFLDCCYGGAFTQGMRARAAGEAHVLEAFAGEKLGGGRGWAVITASNSMEYAFEGSELAESVGPQPSVFTQALVKGLYTGEADLDEDGRVSLDELYEYVFDRVRARNPHQTPSRSVDLQGEVYLARSKRRKIIPVPVPEDLQQAILSPNAYTRRGAVAELRFRMESPELEIAAGARDALLQMAREDIRSIADEAGRAVAEVQLNVSPAVLEFGRVDQHAPSPHREIQLLGPPLARSCVPHPKEEWIHVAEQPDAWDVWVDTAEPGTLTGTLVLKGATGEVAVPVSAEVLAAPAASEVSVPRSEPKEPPRTPPTSRPRESSAASSEPATSVPPKVDGRRGGSAWSWILASSVGALVAGSVASVFAVLGVVTAVEAATEIIRSTAAGLEGRLTAAGERLESLRGSSLVGLILAVLAAVLVAVTRYGARTTERPPESAAWQRAAEICSGVAKGLCRFAIPVLALLFIAALVALKVAANA
ncbi:caspase family protein [Streptomyces durbertensis]|uniref:Caspase family protein n=1 Tax=Streptomyces durbertensis TaxID=2448886 RepID=A0ABR6EBR2_9ACTN|nr:caspase family protein [Streptomyces durbertensis]MBB1242608.1 caspase family protein [Streptomyces durbertensis]